MIVETIRCPHLYPNADKLRGPIVLKDRDFHGINFGNIQSVPQLYSY